ncbi:hypothetical protein [Spirosoma pomorum]
MNKPKGISTNKDLMDRMPHLAEFLPLLDKLNEETPRGKILLGCSYIDELLKKTIEAFLIKSIETNELLNGFAAPIGTFSSRIKLSYALGLISEAEKKEILTLKAIRNLFAHNFKVTFEDPKVKKLCNALTYSAKSYDDVVVDAPGQSNTSAIAIMLNLVNRPTYVARKKLSKQEWPA